MELNPTQLTNYGLGLEDVRSALSHANANSPKGELSGDTISWTLGATDQLLKADQYRPLIVTYHNGAAVRLSDIADVVDSVEDLRNAGMVNAQPAVLIIVFRQPGANIIDTVDRVLAALPQLQAAIPPAIKLTVTLDRTTTIRASVRDVEITLLISVALVILVVYLFLRDVWVTLIPGVAVPISLIGTFGVMYLLGFSLNNLSLMALTISTGFVVDDAIVVLENIIRYVEHGLSPFEAAIRGRRRDRVHRDLDQHLADRGIYSAVADGRNRGPPVPRIRHHAVGGGPGLDGGLFDHDRDDVLEDPARPARGRQPWVPSRVRERVLMDASPL